MGNLAKEEMRDNLGILNAGTGALAGFTITKKGILRIRKLKVKRPNQYNFNN